ncbi:ABC transporter ATP-binding protein [Streptomyces sp. XM4011]|uniref:ATP-binding cassette domain-containing protein n=1 Tax=Streptomyces sp. XM4011 TaxID=2929780 RepID=UPI001FF9ED81|nr:ABC transporter ATP-binding protein [Streptomyces sp. XM4011]MCK1812942.1 ABC transporter ATP-binding protein [Streptomyces sp. XM4011]
MTGPEPALLTLREVGHAYGDTPVLRSVSLDMAPGECVVLLGPNGCGKSTLLRLATGQLRPTTGEVLFAGRPVDENDPGTRARIATALDPTAYYPDLTVREHLMLIALAHGLGEAAERAVTEQLAEHRLTERADALPRALSSGQTQAMLLAAALVRPHDLLILDEPEQRLDARARASLGARLARRKRTAGTAILLATHDAALAAEPGLADRLVEFDDGAVTVRPRAGR